MQHHSSSLSLMPGQAVLLTSVATLLQASPHTCTAGSTAYTTMPAWKDDQAALQ